MNYQHSFLFFVFAWLTLFEVDDSIMHAQVSNDSLGHYYELASNPKEGNDLIKAYQFYTRHKDRSLKHQDTLVAIQDLQLIANVQKDLGFLYDSEASVVEALQLLKQMPSSNATKASTSGLYNQLGILYRAFYNYDKSLEYYQKALGLSQTAKDSSIIINNIGNIHKDQQEFDLAVQAFETAYGTSQKTGAYKSIARSLDNLGFCQSKLQIPDALPNMLQALKIRDEKEDMVGLYSSYKHLSEYYDVLGDSLTALAYADLAYETAQALKSPSFLLEALSARMGLNEHPDVTVFKTLNDSLNKQQQLQDNRYAELRYNVANYKEKVLQTELQAEKEKSTKVVFQALVVVGILLATTLFFIFRYRFKKKRLHQVYLTETRISKKVHDEVANDLSDVMNYVEHALDTAPNGKHTLLNTLEAIYLRTRDISTETASIDFSDFSNSLKHLLIQHNKEDVKVIVNDVNTIEWQKVSDHKKLAVYRCLQELMVNMKKHSHARVVSVAFKKHNNRNEIRYTDDGDGGDRDTMHKNGLLNAEFRMKDVGGRFTFETSKGGGFKAIITFTS